MLHGSTHVGVMVNMPMVVATIVGMPMPNVAMRVARYVAMYVACALECPCTLLPRTMPEPQVAMAVVMDVPFPKFPMCGDMHVALQ